MNTTIEKILPPAAEPKLLEAPRQNEPGKKPADSRRRYIIWGAAAIIFLGALFLFGYWRHHRTQKAAAEAAEKEKQTLPIVNVTKVRRAPNASELLLPGNITPITEAYIYARASGYVRQRYVDIGDRVRQGQLMAEIEAPDLDQQVVQARASLAQAQQQAQQTRAQLDSARSQQEFTRVTWERYKVLVEHGAISRQDADNQYTAYKSASSAVAASQANVAAADQNVNANRANVERLVALQSYLKVRAPFDGVVTARNFDVGALISSNGATLGASSSPSGGSQTSAGGGNAGTSGSTSLVAPQGGSGSGSGGGVGEMFRVAQIHTLRILINAPQENSTSIIVGQPARVFVEQFSKEQFHGKVTRTSNAVDPNTRTLLTEVQVQNPRQILLPGMYAQVQLSHERSDPPLLVPGDSVISRAEGIQVAVLKDLEHGAKDKEGKPYPEGAKRVHIQKVEVGRDYGAEMEVTRGLQGWEHVIVNPGDVVEEGAVVQAAAAARLPGQGKAESKGPSDRTPTGATSEQPGAADKNGRGASEKGGGKKK